MPPTTVSIDGPTSTLTRLAIAHGSAKYHILNFGSQTAIIYEADEPGDGRLITYAELLREVCSVANVLKRLGVKRGDTVSVYLPMTWQAVAAFLACARIGAIHSVVFAGFSSEALRDRIHDCKSRVLLTSDEGRRGGKAIATKAIVDAALKDSTCVEHVLVLKRTGSKVPWTPGRDLWWHEETAKVSNYCPPEVMAAEDPLFILYVSTSVQPRVIFTKRFRGRPLVQPENPRESFTPLVDTCWVLL